MKAIAKSPAHFRFSIFDYLTENSKIASRFSLAFVFLPNREIGKRPRR